MNELSSSDEEDNNPGPSTPSRNNDNNRRGGDDPLVESSPAIPPSPEDSLVPPSPEDETPRRGPARHEDEDDLMDEEDEPVAPPPPPDVDEPLVDEDIALIRGTNVHVPTAAAAFTDFLRNFRSLRHSRLANQRSDDDDDDLSSDEEEEAENLPPPLYLSKLQTLLDRGTLESSTSHSASASTASLDIDSMHIYYHNENCQRFYYQMVAYPAEMVPLMDILVQRELERLAVDWDEDARGPLPRVQVRPYHLREVSNLRELDPVALDSLVSIKGMIVRSSPIIPDLKVAHFQCSICGNNVQVTLDRGKIAEPRGKCSVCNTASSYTLVHNRSLFADKQLVRLQETPDEVPAGQTPASVLTFCYDDLVDSVQPGDKVEVTGVLRAQSVRVHPKIRRVKSVYKTYVDVIHYRKMTGMGRGGDDDNAGKYDNSNNNNSGNNNNNSDRNHRTWSAERIAQLRALSERPDIYDQLTASLAPSIWELDNVKKGILCMLFGGNSVRVKKRRREEEEAETADPSSWLDEDEDEEETDGDASTAKLNKRGDINILLCGDPGTSKSQLLSYVHKLSTRGVYTSGKGSSAVGLTASVVRDPETRDLVLESGALVLSDLGICCIDEFDKMSDTTRSVLHEAMEQQTVSIAKAGILATLPARTSVLASANPTESRYNPNRSVVDNIQLPPTLLSRFDLIYLVLDQPNVDHDRQLAQHLVGLYYETPNVVKPPLDQALLRDYIDYARQHIHPEISQEAADQLMSSYLELRNPGNAAGAGTRTISATPRQLESLIRLSEALAKMHYRTVVTRADAQEAVRLLKVATQAAATDPRTGRIDMDMINTGRSSADRQSEEDLQLQLQELLTQRRGMRMAVRDVTRQLAEISPDGEAPATDMVVDILRRMQADGFIQFHERAQTIFVRSSIAR